jgi:hypothetical protein
VILLFFIEINFLFSLNLINIHFVVKNQMREFFNFILNEEFIESVEHNEQETTNEMVNFIYPKLAVYEDKYKCLIVNINVDNTNKATSRYVEKFFPNYLKKKK